MEGRNCPHNQRICGKGCALFMDDHGKCAHVVNAEAHHKHRKEKKHGKPDFIPKKR
jgi:hypothetical protein